MMTSVIGSASSSSTADWTPIFSALAAVANPDPATENTISRTTSR